MVRIKNTGAFKKIKIKLGMLKIKGATLFFRKLKHFGHTLIAISIRM